MLTLQEFIKQNSLNHEIGIVDEKSKLIMLWSPKAACTTACIMMFRHMGLLEDALKYSKWIHKYRCDIFYHEHGFVNINDHLLSKKYFVFKVIRNPYDRAVSSYLMLIKMTPKEKLKKISFEDFLKHIKINSGIFIDNNEIDHYITSHICPQYVENEEKYINKYVRIENGKRDINEINKLRNINLDINIENKDLLPHHAQRSKTSNKRYLGNVPFDELPYIPASYKCFYNKLTKKLVEEIYADDIINYKYKFYQ